MGEPLGSDGYLGPQCAYEFNGAATELQGDVVGAQARCGGQAIRRQRISALHQLAAPRQSGRINKCARDSRFDGQKLHSQIDSWNTRRTQFL
jgi:hypothetical protein